jgi:hypothetical protein
MRPVSPGVLLWGLIAVGCASNAPPADRTLGVGGAAGALGADASAPGGSRPGGMAGGVAGAGGRGIDGGGGIDGAAGVPPDPTSTMAADASTVALSDAGTVIDVGGITPMGSDGGPQPSYEGEIPIYYGPDPGPVVQMQCPGDPTQGFTEYTDSFHVERPYNVPINSRFSITGGVYNFWVFANDAAHSLTAHGKNPRTEAAFGGTHDMASIPTGNAGNASSIGFFTGGQRIFSADVLIETSAADSIVMQLHTTATGIGPVYVSGNGIPGGMIDRWYNLKIVFDSSTLKSQVYINNCPKGTLSGPRGDGHFYFKCGVYHCAHAGGCRDHYKNIHLYVK